MKIIFVSLIVLFLSACGTKVVNYGKYQSNDSVVYVSQHFTSNNKNEADLTASNYCKKFNADAIYESHKPGCMFTCRSEYHIYSYKCENKLVIANRNIENNKKLSKLDFDTCEGWGYKRGTDKFADCMLKLHEVRIAVDLASKQNSEIAKMSEQQRRSAENIEALQWLNYANSISQNQRQINPQPSTSVPFTCTRFGNSISCR